MAVHDEVSLDDLFFQYASKMDRLLHRGYVGAAASGSCAEGINNGGEIVCCSPITSIFVESVCSMVILLSG
jgi:hypothetical protein